MITNTTWSVGVALGAPDRNTVPWILEDKRLMHINKNTHTHTQTCAWSTWFFVNLMSTHTHRAKGQRARLHITRFDGTTVSKWNTLPYSAFFFPFYTSLSVFFSFISLTTSCKEEDKVRSSSVTFSLPKLIWQSRLTAATGLLQRGFLFSFHCHATMSP